MNSGWIWPGFDRAALLGTSVTLPQQALMHSPCIGWEEWGQIHLTSALISSLVKADISIPNDPNKVTPIIPLAL